MVVLDAIGIEEQTSCEAPADFFCLLREVGSRAHDTSIAGIRVTVKWLAGQISQSLRLAVCLW